MMKLLFDQNISPKILKNLPSQLSQSQQVRFVELEDASDMEIFKYAKNQGFTIVTFDSDFVDLNALFGTPPKVIYLNTGNLTTSNIAQLIEKNMLRIGHYLKHDSDEILEIARL
ncbi:MAG TPA: DUF5615 family PIN-like protein [Cryomorphaceae bacterium]|nr:DUF5615 family PIN-like protein [Cryomorphaceae bacterium]